MFNLLIQNEQFVCNEHITIRNNYENLFELIANKIIIELDQANEEQRELILLRLLEHPILLAVNTLFCFQKYTLIEAIVAHIKKSNDLNLIPLFETRQQQIITALKILPQVAKLDFIETIEYCCYRYQQGKLAEINIQQRLNFYDFVLSNQVFDEIIDKAQQRLRSVKNGIELIFLFEKLKSHIEQKTILPSATIQFNFINNLLKIALIIAVLVLICYMPVALAGVSKQQDTNKPNHYNPTLYYPVAAQSKHSLTQPTKDFSNLCLNTDYISADLTNINTCQVITAEYIENFIIGNPDKATIDKITQTILQARAIDPVITNYIDIVFNYLPGFKILSLTYDQFKTKEKGLHSKAAYNVWTRTLQLPHNLLPREFMGAIIHELRHALMHTIQIARAKSKISFSLECYFPLTESEKNRFAKMIEKGDNIVDKIAKLLVLEKKNQLNNVHKNDLKKLRKLSMDCYENYENYGFITEQEKKYVSLKEAKLEAPLGKQFESSLQGILEVYRYVKNKDNTWQVHLRSVDPLYSLVNSAAAIKDALKTEYSIYQYYYEWDAHLYHRFPIPLIKEIYTEAFNYGNDLIKNTFFGNSPLPIKNNFQTLEDYDDHDLDDLISISNKLDSDSLNERDVKFIYGRAAFFANHKANFEKAEILLNILINNGFDLGGTIHLQLAEIAYKRHNYKQACNHYEMASKQGLELYPIEALQYGKSSLAIEDYQTAEKICKQMVKLKKATSVIAECKKILEEIYEKQSNSVHAFKR